MNNGGLGSEFIDFSGHPVIKTNPDGNKQIAIGGGHNNAYPLIKGAAKGLHKFHGTHLAQINCINLDAHSDYRPLEGRHSGNAFRYAEEDGFLGKYAIIGLHENYIPQNILTELNNNPFIHYSTFEEIFIMESKNFTQSISHAIGFTEDNYCGIEIDLDSISNVLCSAPTATGINSLQARTFINFVSTDAKLAYFHISEGACQTIDGKKDELTGKLISQLVCDFIKSSSKQ
jgi:formiminoglutamase